MSSTFRTLGQSELLPRYIFAESLYARRRVLEIGAVASTLGQSARFLSTRGARIVVAADSDLSAVQTAQQNLAGPNLRFRASVFDDLETGSFDLVIVADLAPYVRAPELLKELVRLVSRSGYLMGGLRNPAGLSLATVMEAEGQDPTPTYGQLLDALSAHFRSIEVATQSPVLGYQLAFEKGEGLQVDGSLAGASEAAYYVVLAGHEPVRFFDPTWVQLPPEPLAFTGGKLEDASSRARNWQERSDRLKDALAKSKDEVGRKESELKALKDELDGTREATARLTAQLEQLQNTPQENRQADELTAKVRRMEAELTVARERAIDAEGRVTSMRAEVELHQREQKSATIDTLAAQENARLERTRREELSTQLDDTRTRLTRAYEEMRVVQDEAAGQRIEAERARLETNRTAETLSARERELSTAREKEMRLAQAQSDAMSAIEGLKRQLDDTSRQLGAANENLEKKELDRQSVLRSLELEATRVRESQGEAQNLTARVAELSEDLSEKQSTLTATETELESTRADKARLQRDIETLAQSERTWREMAQQFEGRLHETLANVNALSEQVASLQAEAEHEQARFRRLESDLTTAVGAERSAREQAQASFAQSQTRGRELEDDNQQLVEQRDDLTASLDDLRKAREEDGRKIDELTARVHDLTDELDVAKARQLELQEAADEAQQQLKDTLTERERAWDETRNALSKRIEELGAEQKNSEVSWAESRRAVAQMQKDREAAWDETRQRLGAQLEELDGQLQARQAEVAELNERLHEQHEQSERDREEYERRAATVSERETQTGRDLAAARNEAARLSGQLDLGRQRVAEFAQRASRLEAEGAAISRRLADSEALALERQGQIDAIREQLTAAEAAAQQSDQGLREQLSALETASATERETAEQTIAALRTQVSELESSAQKATTRAYEREREAEQVRDSLAATEAARTRLEELVQADRQEHTGTVSQLGAELGQTREALDDAKTRESALREQLQALTDEVELGRERLADEKSAREAAEREAQARLESATDAAGRELQQTRENAERDLREAREAGEREVQAARGVSEQRIAELEAEGHARRTEFEGRQKDYESRLSELTERIEHLDAELAFGVEARTGEVELREQIERERDRLRDEASTAAQWVVGGKAENEKLSGELDELRADLERTRSDLASARQTAENAQRELEAERTETGNQRAQVESKGNEVESLTGQLGAARTELGVASQQLVAAKEDTERASAEGARLKNELQALQTRLDEQTRSTEQETSASRDAHARELEALRAQVDAAKAEQQVMKQILDRTQSEARGHQSAKLTLQNELDKLRGQVSQLESSVAAAGGEAKAVTEAREKAEAELEAIARRAEAAEAKQAETASRLSELEAQLAQAAEREKGALAEVEEARGAAQGSAGDLEAAVTARRTAEELLIKMRARYTEIEQQLQTEVPALREQLQEQSAENQLLDAERDRLALHTERLEAAKAELESRLQAVQMQLDREKTGQVETLYQAERERADLEAQLKLVRGAAVDREQRLELLERRLKAQDAELVALRRRPNVGSQSGVKVPLPPALKPTASPPVLQKVPSVAPPIAPVKPPGEPLELEVFELDVDENGDDEELLLLEDEASDPGSKDPRKR